MQTALVALLLVRLVTVWLSPLPNSAIGLKNEVLIFRDGAVIEKHTRTWVWSPCGGRMLLLCCRSIDRFLRCITIHCFLLILCFCLFFHPSSGGLGRYFPTIYSSLNALIPELNWDYTQSWIKQKNQPLGGESAGIAPVFELSSN